MSVENPGEVNRTASVLGKITPTGAAGRNFLG